MIRIIMAVLLMTACLAGCARPEPGWEAFEERALSYRRAYGRDWRRLSPEQREEANRALVLRIIDDLSR